MHVLCLSNEWNFLRHLSEAFSDRIEGIDCKKDPRQFLDAAFSGLWDIYLIDFDALTSSFPNPVEFVKMLPSNSRALIVGSASFADWHQRLQQQGAVVLHKPNAIGEVGLVLQKLAGTRRTKRVS